MRALKVIAFDAAGRLPTEGAVVGVLIHSPSRMFGRAQIAGDPFRWTFEVTPGAPLPRGCKYCATAVEPVRRPRSHEPQAPLSPVGSH